MQQSQSKYCFTIKHFPHIFDKENGISPLANANRAATVGTDAIKFAKYGLTLE